MVLDYRGRIMHRICGVSNAGDGDARVQECIAALPHTVPWDVSDFAYNVNWWQVLNCRLIIRQAMICAETRPFVQCDGAQHESTCAGDVL